MKPFKNHDELIEILISRGLVIKNKKKTKNVFENITYYALINGYKDLFLIKDPNNIPVIPESYKTDTKFEEIYDLFLFDRELRNVFLEYLLIFESSIKSKISYFYSDKFKQTTDYLNPLNFTNNKSKFNQIIELIGIMNLIIKEQNKHDGPVKHYLLNHGGVPIWVMMNYLTLGNINKFYDSIDPSLQNTIASSYSIQFLRNYRKKEMVYEYDILSILKLANLFRNCCAHGERFYNYKLKKQPMCSNISKIINVDTTLLRGNLFTMASFLKVVLEKKDYADFVKKLSKLFVKYQNKFVKSHINEVLNEMGFPANWHELLIKS